MTNLVAENSTLHYIFVHSNGRGIDIAIKLSFHSADTPAASGMKSRTGGPAREQVAVSHPQSLLPYTLEKGKVGEAESSWVYVAEIDWFGGDDLVVAHGGGPRGDPCDPGRSRIRSGRDAGQASCHGSRCHACSYIHCCCCKGMVMQ